MATPRPVSVAFATILFAIVWLVFALKRLSLPESAFSLHQRVISITAAYTPSTVCPIRR